MNLRPVDVRPDNVWQYRQNHPKLIIRDLIQYGVPDYITARILMARGVYKWLACRRDLIRLKNEWKKQIKELYSEVIKLPKDSPERKIIGARIKTLEQCRKQVRIICHSERWRFQDNHETNKLLEVDHEAQGK